MAQDNKNDTTSENAIGWLIMLVVFAALGWLIWHYFEFQIKSGIRWVRYAEMSVVALFVDDDYTVRLGGENYRFDSVHKATPDIPAQNLSSDTMIILNEFALAPLRWAFIFIIGLMAVWAMFKGPNTHYRRKLDLEGLIRAQSSVFQVIAPFVSFNPGKQPPRAPGTPVPAELPLFAEALGPEEWLAYNSIPVPDGRIDEDAARLAFTRQLAGRWKGSRHLAPHKQVLMAAFCLKAARKRDLSDEMLGRLANCWSPKKGLNLGADRGLLREARKVLGDAGLVSKTMSKINQHGFETTAILRALATAREEGGVLAPAQFVWLRGFDRDLWYALNNLGRQSYHMEGLGAMAHYKAEKLTMRPIPKPKVDDAVKSIVSYMSSNRARPIPQLDYAGTGKSGIKKPRGARKS